MSNFQSQCHHCDVHQQHHYGEGLRLLQTVRDDEHVDCHNEQYGDHAEDGVGEVELRQLSGSLGLHYVVALYPATAQQCEQRRAECYRRSRDHTPIATIHAIRTISAIFATTPPK